MDFKVIWAPSARLDLKEIVSYIAEDNPEIAQRFGLSLIDTKKPTRFLWKFSETTDYADGHRCRINEELRMRN